MLHGWLKESLKTKIELLKFWPIDAKQATTTLRPSRTIRLLCLSSSSLEPKLRTRIPSTLLNANPSWTSSNHSWLSTEEVTSPSSFNSKSKLLLTTKSMSIPVSTEEPVMKSAPTTSIIIKLNLIWMDSKADRENHGVILKLNSSKSSMVLRKPFLPRLNNLKKMRSELQLLLLI